MSKSHSLFYKKGQLYDNFRPDYPLYLIDNIESFFNLSIAGNVVEFGCGTGKFTKILLNANAISRLIAVEPDDEMLSYFLQGKTYSSSLSVIKGTAESSTLQSKSIDIIFSAQAFHHFDPLLCIPEFQRILKENGKIILIWYFSNMTSLLSREIRKCFYSFGKKQAQRKRLEITNKSIGLLFPDHIVESCDLGKIIQDLTYGDFLGSMCSSSYAPKKNSVLYNDYIKHFEKIYRKHENKGLVTCDFNIVGYYIS